MRESVFDWLRNHEHAIQWLVDVNAAMHLYNLSQRQDKIITERNIS